MNFPLPYKEAMEKSARWREENKKFGEEKNLLELLEDQDQTAEWIREVTISHNDLENIINTLKFSINGTVDKEIASECRENIRNIISKTFARIFDDTYVLWNPEEEISSPSFPEGKEVSSLREE